MSLTSEAVWAASPAASRGLPTQLSADSKSQRIAYASNKSVFLRSIDNPSLSTQYTAHTSQTTVARFAPSGFYVASGDASGTVRIWDCVGEGASKGEYNVISGRINDIAWDGDSQRIIAVGDGKQRFGHCFTADSGNSVGEVSGHAAQVNSVSIRQQRPLRAATASDDSTTVFYHGAPFKYNTSLRDQHSGFVYGTAFSPDGTTLVTVGADKKICLYDGKSGEPRGQLGSGEHKGSIFGVSWAADSRSLVTASADRTIKVWDVESEKVAQSWDFTADSGNNVPYHQVGVVWPAGRSDNLIISLSLNGDLNYVALGTEKPTRTVQGHPKNITAASKTARASEPGETLWTGSYDGRICSWDIATASAACVRGPGHTNYIAGLAPAISPADKIYSIGWDDTLKAIDVSTNEYMVNAAKLSSQPKAIAHLFGSIVAVATSTDIEVHRGTDEVLCSVPLKSTPLAVAAIPSSNGTAVVAIGGEDKSIRIFEFDSSKSRLTLKQEVSTAKGQVTSLAFSPDKRCLAAGDSLGKILVHDTTEYKVKIDRWSAHTGRVTTLSWNQDSTYAASGGLDTHIFVWSVESPGKRIKVTNAHKEGVNGVSWTADGKRIVSVGTDAAVKLWRLQLNGP